MDGDNWGTYKYIYWRYNLVRDLRRRLLYISEVKVSFNVFSTHNNKTTYKCVAVTKAAKSKHSLNKFPIT